MGLRASEDIQGNILASFNKQYQRFLFISFMNNRAGARSWLGQLVDEVASTTQVAEHGVARQQAQDRGEKLPTHVWVGVSFTSSGLVVLNSDLANGLVAFDAFWEGPLVDRQFDGARTTSPAVVGDVDRGDPRRWVVGGPRQYPVDALLTVAADDPDELNDAANEKRDLAVTCGLKVLSWQDCQRRVRDNYGIEPFGFRDGISQPGIRGFTRCRSRSETNASRRKISPARRSSPQASSSWGTAGAGGSYPDVRRSRLPEWMRDGSFQVFLRLRQDVDGWQAKMDELSPLSTPDDAAAAAIGRALDGKPLAAPGQGGISTTLRSRRTNWGNRPRGSHICAR